MNNNQPSVLRLLAIGLFGSAFLRFEGKQLTKIEAFMNKLNIKVAADSIAAIQVNIARVEEELKAGLGTDAALKKQGELETLKEQLTQLQTAANQHQQVQENIAYKQALLKSI